MAMGWLRETWLRAPRGRVSYPEPYVRKGSSSCRNLSEKQRVLELVVDTPKHASCLGLISMLSRSRRIKRSFQWLSVILAGALLAIGLVLMTFDVVELDPWNVQQHDTPNVLTSLLLGALGLFLACAALWAIVQAFGWIIVKILSRHETQ